MYYGVTNVGTSPTIDNDEKVSVETHILNFNGTIYGNSVEIRLFEKLRAQKKFDNFSMLLEQESIRLKAHARRLHKSALLYRLYQDWNTTYTGCQTPLAIDKSPLYQFSPDAFYTIFQIRKKLKPYADGHDFIKTMVGYGYKFQGKSG